MICGSQFLNRGGDDGRSKGNSGLTDQGAGTLGERSVHCLYPDTEGDAV